MFQREILTSAVEDVALRPSEVVEVYPDDEPFPSRLLLGWVQGEPLHVHLAEDREGGRLIIVTTYRPDPARWQAGFTRRMT